VTGTVADEQHTSSAANRAKATSMSLLPASFSDAFDVEIAAVASQLAEIDTRRIVEPFELAEAWADLRRCDEAATSALEPVDARLYRIIVDTPISSHRRTRARAIPVVDARVERLHQAIHRRLILLQDLTEL
jgi:hypothetical protein